MRNLEKSTTYEQYKYFVPSPILASQGTERRRKARRKPQKMTPLTYRDLLEEQARAVQNGTLNKQTAANRASALRLFLRVHHFMPEDVVGQEFRTGYRLAEAQFADAMQKEGRDGRSISNLRAALTPWRQAIAQNDKLRELEEGGESPFAKHIRMLVAGAPVKRFARQTGVRAHLIYTWMNGTSPKPGSLSSIRRLESFFGIERDWLVTLSGVRDYWAGREPVGTPPPNAYRDRLAVVRHQRYLLKVPEASPLRLEWKELIRYKTAPVPSLLRPPRGTWTFSPHQNTAHKGSWFAHFDEQTVPSANMTWSVISSYLGWLRLEKEKGGPGLPEEIVHTLAWLASTDHLEDYIKWRMNRADKTMSVGILNIVVVMLWMNRPVDGYLYQSPHFQGLLPEAYRRGDWKTMCEASYKYCERLFAYWKNKVQAGRSTFDAVRTTIDCAEPLQEIADMVQRMKADRPIGNPEREAVWARDILLIKLLASNPLRRVNIITLHWNEKNVNGYRPNDGASIYQRVDGSWWIYSPGAFFKNRGANLEDYDSPIQESTWPDLERYLFKYRPRLLRWPTDLVFLAVTRDPEKKLTKKGLPYKQAVATEHMPFLNIGNHVAKLTQRYLRNSGGSRMHAFRNVVATAILKADGGDIKTAALVLHDKQTTVEKHYAWLQSGDGNRRMGELLKSSFDRM